MKAAAVTGSLLGLAVGDALGLPCEGLSPQRIQHWFGKVQRYHLLAGRGLLSDDTEHAVMVAQSLIEAGGDIEYFQHRLAQRLKWWLLALPAGVGWATLRAAGRLLIGVSPAHSGVFSAGNGPAMRSPLIGVLYGQDADHLQAMVRASTLITHCDPKALQGALAVAVAAHLAATLETVSGSDYLAALPEYGVNDAVLTNLLQRAAESATAGESPATFAAALSLHNGVTGYMYHTVPVVIQTWLRYPDDFAAALPAIIACGGDTDTTAAILGSILGAGVGLTGIPTAWLYGIVDYPRSPSWLLHLSHHVQQLADSGQAAVAPRLSAFAILPRNLLFMLIVLAHGFRRLLPPY